MREYVLAVLIVGILGSCIGLLAPEGEGGGLGKHVRLAVGVVLIAVCLSPLVSLIDSLRELDLQGFLPDGEARQEYESLFEEGFSTAEKETAEEGIVRLLCDRFGIDEGEAEVSLQITEEGDGTRRITRIVILLYGSAVWKDTGAIEDYLQGLFSCEVITAIG